MSELSQNTTAIILAGGFGTRLKSLIPDKQKVIAPIAGQPFLKYLLLQLNSFKIRNVILCTGHLAEQVEVELGKKFKDINISYSIENSPLGTAGAVAKALEKVNTSDILVINGDSYCDYNLEDFYKWHKNKNSSASILLSFISDTERFGRVELEDEQIKNFREKGIKGEGLINAGIYLFSKECLNDIPKNKACSMEKELFPHWVDKKILNGYKANVKYFIDIGTPESFKQAEIAFSKWNNES